MVKLLSAQPWRGGDRMPSVYELLLVIKEKLYIPAAQGGGDI
jgi:hypothetical protein